MSKRITLIYRKKPKIKTRYSLLGYLKDAFFSSLPKFSKPFINKVYGKSNFVFLVHPRRFEDVVIALPFLAIFTPLSNYSWFRKLLAQLPPFVLEKVEDKKKRVGFVVSSLTLPDIIINDAREAVMQAKRCLRLVDRISQGKYIGLGGLWPMVTRRGIALSPLASEYGKKITNGHCGTAVSVFLTIKKLSNISGIRMDQLFIAIIGVGKMGSNFAMILAKHVAGLTLIDVNLNRLERLQVELLNKYPMLQIQLFRSHKDSREIKQILAANHLAVCATSNISKIFKPIEIPDSYILIDDSRPEAIPRILGDNSKIVLEGGLMRIKGVKLAYDYGFGIGENVFGCFAETYLLSADEEKTIRPTLGIIEESNFYKMIEACKLNDVVVGSFKSSDRDIPSDRLRGIMLRRHELIMPVRMM